MSDYYSCLALHLPRYHRSTSASYVLVSCNTVLDGIIVAQLKVVVVAVRKIAQMLKTSAWLLRLIGDKPQPATRGRWRSHVHKTGVVILTPELADALGV